jgi:cytochrome c-type protein NapB
MKPSTPDPHTLSSRASRVVLAMAVVTAVSGYFMGLRQVDRAHGPAANEARQASLFPMAPANRVSVTSAFSSQEIPTIVDYAALGTAGLKPNARWKSSLESLRRGDGRLNASSTPGVTPSPASDAERLQAVQRRAGRRAFDGAPPVVPHPVDATSSANCRVCHAEGLVVRDVVAPRMSHPEMGNCTQCHVPSDGGVPSVAPEWRLALAANDFVGKASVGRGSRAWPGAPPHHSPCHLDAGELLQLPWRDRIAGFAHVPSRAGVVHPMPCA